MPREILGEVVNPSVKVGTKRRHAVPVSIACHALVLGLVLAGPVVSGDVLPLPRLMRVFSAPLPPAKPPEPPPVVRAMDAPRPTDSIDDAAPLTAPSTVTPEPAREMPRGLGGTTAAPNGLGFGSAPGVALAGPPATPAPATPVRVGGAIQPPQLVARVNPAYPAFARNARLQGHVILEATIARDGAVKDVRLLKSAHPLLDKAALDAVARWKYSPTTLNGDAVEVLLSVTVTFTLQ